MKIKIIWCAFEKSYVDRPAKSAKIGRTSYETEINVPVDYPNYEQICDVIYQQTNIYAGDFWETNNKKFPKDRSHTAISVGDIIEVNGIPFKCENAGWSKIQEEVAV